MPSMKSIRFPGSSTVYEVTDAAARAQIAALQADITGLDTAAVLYDGAQTLTANQQAQARDNIQAASGDELTAAQAALQSGIDTNAAAIDEQAASVRDLYASMFPDELWTKLTLINADVNQNAADRALRTDRPYHIATESVLQFAHALTVATTDATLQVADRIYASDGSFVSTVGWKRTLTIPALTPFRLVFRAQPDDTSVTLDIETSMAKVTFTMASALDSIPPLIEKVDSVMDYRLIGVPTTGGNRAYIALGQVDGLYLTTHGTSGIWTAFQGFTAADYSGDAAYTSGKINNVPTRLQSSVTGLYYRVVFGVDSGNITTEQAADAFAYIYGARTDSTLTQKGVAADAEAVHRALLRPTGIVSVMHGGTNVYPQNTLETYRRAYRAGILYWECDVFPTADGSYVLCHDDDICTHALTAGGAVIESDTVKITETNLADLRGYNFGVMTGATPTVAEGFDGETIPTLEEFLVLAKAAGAVPFVEIKFSAETDALHTQHVTNVVNLIKKHGLLDTAYIIAYARGALTAQAACAAGIRHIAMIYNNGEASTSAADAVAGWVADYRDQLQDVVYMPSVGNLVAAPAVAEYASTLGMRAGAWALQKSFAAATLTTLMEAGVTFYITNYQEIGDVARGLLGLVR